MQLPVPAVAPGVFQQFPPGGASTEVISYSFQSLLHAVHTRRQTTLSPSRKSVSRKTTTSCRDLTAWRPTGQRPH